MRTLIPLWHENHDQRRNRSQLLIVPIEFKSDSTYFKHTIEHFEIHIMKCIK